MSRHTGLQFRAPPGPAAAKSSKPATRSPDTPLDYGHGLGSSALGDSSSGSDLAGLPGRVTYELDPQTDELLIKRAPAPAQARFAPSSSGNIIALFDTRWFGVSAPDDEDADDSQCALPSALGLPPQQFPRPAYPPSLGAASAASDHSEERAGLSPSKSSADARMHAASAFATATAQGLVAPASLSRLASVPMGVSLPVAMQGPGFSASGSSRGADHKGRATRGNAAAAQPSGPGLGTWALRQLYLMPGKNAKGSTQQQAQQQQQRRQQQGVLEGQREGEESSSASYQDAISPSEGALVSHERSQPQPAPSVSGRRQEDDDAEVAAAWRWRFARRWHQEQVRAPDTAASAGTGDGMEEALQYLEACGERWDMARTQSTDAMLGGSTAEPRLLGTTLSVNTPAQSLLAGELMSYEEPSPSGHAVHRRNSFGRSMGSRGTLSGLAAEATREVRGMHRRAAELMAAQQNIDRAVTARWQEVDGCGEAWVGAFLNVVEVDDWGSFRFVLLRLRDRNGRHKFLVRGHNYASDAQVLGTAHKQMLSAAGAHNVMPEALENCGGGTMEWRRDRDRHLSIHSGYVQQHGTATGAMTATEVMNLAGVLTKQHLPMHYKVTVEGGRVM